MSHSEQKIYSIDEEREWLASPGIKVLHKKQSPEGRHECCIRLYNLCVNKETMKALGYNSIEAVAAYLRTTHTTKSKTMKGFSVSHFRTYRNEGKIYEMLKLAGITFDDMPQTAETGIALYSLLATKGETVVDIWRSALLLGDGDAGNVREDHITEVVDGEVQPNETDAAATAAAATAEIKKLKDDMKKQKADAEKKRKNELAALEKKNKDTIAALKKEMDESKKRALPDDIRTELDESRLRKKQFEAYKAGHFYNVEANKYIPVSKEELLESAQTVKLICEREQALYEPPQKHSEEAIEFFSTEFAPYYRFFINVCASFGFDLDSPNLSDADSCAEYVLNILSKDNK